MATPVAAKIVVAQAGFTPPAGYTAGSVDGLALGAEVTCTNLSDAGVIAWTWEVFPAVGQSLASYGVAGAGSPALTLTPPASTGYGDVAVRLTVYGDPLPGGRPNISTDEVLLGIRAPNGVYTAGVPIPHPHESQVGGKIVLDPTRGAQGRMSEVAIALAQGAGGGGGSPVYLTQKNVSAGGSITLTSSDLAAETIELTGSPASDVTLTMSPGSSLYGRAWRIVNATGSATKLIKIADGGGGIWIPPGMSRVVGVRSSGAVFVADGMGSSFEFQTTLAAPVGTGTFTNDLFMFPTGWAIELIAELVTTGPTSVTGLTADTVVGVLAIPQQILKQAPPEPTGTPRGYAASDWDPAYSGGPYGDPTTNRQISQQFIVTGGSLAGAVVTYTIAGRRLRG